MTRRLQENLIVLMLLAVLCAVIWVSFDYGERARMVPVPIAVIGILFLLLQLYWQNTRPADDLNIDVFEFLTGRKEDTVEDLVESGKGPKAPLSAATARRREYIGLGLIVLITALSMVLGAIPMSIIFGLLYFRVFAKYSILNTLLLTAATTLSVYLLFDYALGVQLDRTMFGYGLLYYLDLQ